MKILESQAAVLTNYEVFQHVTEQRERYKNAKRRGPPNLETVVREVRLFLKKAQSSEDCEKPNYKSRNHIKLTLLPASPVPSH